MDDGVPDVGTFGVVPHKVMEVYCNDVVKLFFTYIMEHVVLAQELNLTKI